MFKQLKQPVARILRQEPSAWLACTRECVSVAVGPEHADVPAGHHKSDMRDTACNIGLNRRRDLTLRQDIRLHSASGEHKLADLLKGKLTILFGVPDMGKVCKEAHVPSYVELAGDMKAAGVDNIFCVAVGAPEAAQSWGQSLNMNKCNIEMLADKNGGFTRSLGVNVNPPEASSGPYSHRYAALVEDGILLKLRVDESPLEVKASSAQSMLDCLKHLQSLN